MSQNKPLVTIAMMTYNQEKYVRDSVRGMLSQTYEPLEIVISDDCSTDRTWDIINEEIDAYRKSSGIHKNIVLNRNGKNLGIGKHASVIGRFGHGVLRIGNGGDDVSLPNRAERIVEVWKQSSGKLVAIYSDAWVIDQDNHVVGEIKMRPNGTTGAVATYSERLGKAGFGAIEELSAAEDEVFANRAVMVGERYNVPEKLLFYRVGSGVSSGKVGYRKKQVRLIQKYDIGSYKQLRRDIDRKRGELGENRYAEFLRKIISRLLLDEGLLELMDGGSFGVRLNGFRKIKGLYPWKRRCFYAIFLLPHTIVDFLLDTGVRLFAILKSASRIFFTPRRFRSAQLLLDSVTRKVL